MRNQHSHCSTIVCRQCRTRIKAEPAYPKHTCTRHGHCQVMWRHCCRAKAFTRPHHDGGDKGSDPSGDVNDRPTSKILKTHVTEPAATPNPVANRRVNQQHPRCTEHEHGGKLHSLGKPTHDQGRCNNREGQLKHYKQCLGYSVAHTVYRHIRQKEITHITHVRTGLDTLSTKCDRITCDEP